MKISVILNIFFLILLIAQLSSALGLVRVLYALNDPTNKDVTLVGTLNYTFVNLTYGSIPSDYRNVTSGTYKIGFSTLKVNDTPSITVDDGENKTLVIASSGSEGIFHIDELLPQINSSFALIRFIHAAYSVNKSLSVTLEDYSPQVVDFKTSTDYTAIKSDEYDITVNDTTNAQIFNSSSNLKFKKGGIYSVFLISSDDKTVMLVTVTEVQPKGSLSTGAVIAIVLACIVGVCLIIGLIVFLVRRSKRVAYEHV